MVLNNPGCREIIQVAPKCLKQFFTKIKKTMQKILPESLFPFSVCTSPVSAKPHIRIDVSKLSVAKLFKKMCKGEKNLEQLNSGK